MGKTGTIKKVISNELVISKATTKAITTDLNKQFYDRNNGSKKNNIIKFWSTWNIRSVNNKEKELTQEFMSKEK